MYIAIYKNYNTLSYKSQSKHRKPTITQTSDKNMTHILKIQVCCDWLTTCLIYQLNSADLLLSQTAILHTT